MSDRSTNLLLSTTALKNGTINDNSNQMQRAILSVYLWPRDISLYRLVFESERPIKAANSYWAIR